MKTQVERILEYMLNVGPITAIIALNEIGCMRLPARIKEINDEGWNVKSRWVTHTNQNGEKKRYKEYWLEEALM